MTHGLMGGFARIERFSSVGSTNDVVRGWLADGVPEIALAVADEQTAGRGRNGRTWSALPGAALLLSLGFRPRWLDPDRTWRLAGIVALAMADAAETVASLPAGLIRFKWPNDLVVVAKGLAAGHDAGAAGAGTDPVRLLKVAGILGETDGLGTDDPRAVVGIGINADWRAVDFPLALASGMTSLREIAGGRSIDRDALLDAFMGGLERRADALRSGRFDIEDWAARQVTTGHLVELAATDGSTTTGRATGVDGASGALIVESAGPHGQRLMRRVLAGEVVHLRLPSASVV